MKYFRYVTERKELTVYPLVCWHVGSPRSDEKFIKQTVQRIADDPNARWIYLGDGGECNIKASKGDVYSQTMPPGEQLNYLKGLFRPILRKGLFAVNGNHGRRIYKETGMDFDEELALRLQVPYMGLSCFFHLQVRRSHYDVFAHHGLSSGASLATKVNAAKKLNALVVADAILSAHSHICCELPPQHVAHLDTENRGNGNRDTSRIKWRTTAEYVCGCAYDSRGGYAEEKGYTPIIPAHLSVTFGGLTIRGIGQKSQSCNIWRAGA